MADYALMLSDIGARGLGPVSLALVPGEIAGLVGPAAAGKTRMLRIAAGLLTPHSGEARAWGMSVSDPAARALIGYAGDHPAFPHALTVREVLLYCARLHCARSGGNGRRPPGLVRGGL